MTDAAVRLLLREGISKTKTKVLKGTRVSEMKFFIPRFTFIGTLGRQVYVSRSSMIFMVNLNKANYLKNLIENK
jgi:hypothetical protein